MPTPYSRQHWRRSSGRSHVASPEPTPTCSRAAPIGLPPGFFLTSFTATRITPNVTPSFRASPVVDTAGAMAQVHALTEELDQAMALGWLGQLDDSQSEARRYLLTWREV